MDALITVDLNGTAKAYDPMVFGGFIEHFESQIYGGIFDPGSPLSDAQGFRRDVVAAMQELKLSVVRWPGGCFASGYHWKDGVGKTRTPVPDPVWGVTDPNTFGTLEFVQWCRLVGCEPYICNNAGNGTSEEMRDWVAYCNATQGEFAAQRAADGHPEPLHVRLWSIGNENWGGHEIGARTPDEWGPLVHRSATLMRGADPTLTLAAAATANRDWTLPLLKAAGDELQYVAVHKYWLGLWQDNQMPDYLTCIMQSQGPEQTIEATIKILDEAGFRGRIKIAFDEWNLRGWHHPGFPRKAVLAPDDTAGAEYVAKRARNAIASQYTMADALFSASFLNACLRHNDDVTMANIAPIVNTRGPLHVHPGGIVKRTTFHTLAMYANLLKTHVVPLDIQSRALRQGDNSIPVIDALATTDASRNLWAIVLINRHPDQAQTCHIEIGDRALKGTYPTTRLSGDSADAFNDVQNPDRVVPVETTLMCTDGAFTLPPHSISIVRSF